MKKNRKLKEFFDYTEGIPVEELMSILDEEWQDYNGGNSMFRESTHYEDESRDEDRYIEISAIMEFMTPWATGYEFSNKRVQNLYDDAIDEIYNEAQEDEDEFDRIIEDYDMILFVLTIDLKENLIYADVDLGGRLPDTEVARERLADNEKDFRKQIQRMIESF